MAFYLPPTFPLDRFEKLIYTEPRNESKYDQFKNPRQRGEKNGYTFVSEKLTQIGDMDMSFQNEMNDGFKVKLIFFNSTKVYKGNQKTKYRNGKRVESHSGKKYTKPFMSTSNIEAGISVSDIVRIYRKVSHKKVKELDLTQMVAKFCKIDSGSGKSRGEHNILGRNTYKGISCGKTKSHITSNFQSLGTSLVLFGERAFDNLWEKTDDDYDGEVNMQCISATIQNIATDTFMKNICFFMKSGKNPFEEHEETVVFEKPISTTELLKMIVDRNDMEEGWRSVFSKKLSKSRQEELENYPKMVIQRPSQFPLLYPYYAVRQVYWSQFTFGKDEHIQDDLRDIYWRMSVPKKYKNNRHKYYKMCGEDGFPQYNTRCTCHYCSGKAKNYKHKHREGLKKFAKSHVTM